MGKKKRWDPRQLKVNQTKVSQERFEQLLAEVGEVLYKRLCQQVSPVKSDDLSTTSSSTEPFVAGLDKDKIFTQTLKKGS